MPGFFRGMEKGRWLAEVLEVVGSGCGLGGVGAVWLQDFTLQRAHKGVSEPRSWGQFGVGGCMMALAQAIPREPGHHTQKFLRGSLRAVMMLT